MKSLLIFSFAILFTAVSCKHHQESLYPVVAGNKWGYIDAEGRIRIKPQFFAAGIFREGLAPVRIAGSYGYIDMEGQLRIPAQFDYALPFFDGVALAFIAAKPYLINRKGHILFEHPFVFIMPSCQPGLWKVKTSSSGFGLINKDGKLVADTVFREISPFRMGVALVKGLNDGVRRPGISGLIKETGIINANGHFVVPYNNTYDAISDLDSGCFSVWFKPSDSAQKERNGFLDSKGNMLFSIPSGTMFITDPRDFQRDFSIVSLYLFHPDSSTTSSYHNRYFFPGFVDHRGQLIKADTLWEKLTPFFHGRAFVRQYDPGNNGKWALIDGRGKMISSYLYDEVLYGSGFAQANAFIDGIAFVRTGEQWFGIDANGNPVTKARRISPAYSGYELSRWGDIILISKSGAAPSDQGYCCQYGFWDSRSDLLVSPQFYDLDKASLMDSLIAVVFQDGTHGYIDHRGKTVWKAAVDPAVHSLNIDFMSCAYFAATSERPDLLNTKSIPVLANYPQRLSREMKQPSASLLLTILDTVNATWNKTSAGRVIRLNNQTQDTAFFNSQDNRLSMNLQAKDKDGQWKDIEWLPKSWCGNSYKTLRLPPGMYWTFTCPKYEGAIRTKLRLQLRYCDIASSGRNKEKILYSNEIDGSVNPGQFWRKEEYVPDNLMNPYR